MTVNVTTVPQIKTGNGVATVFGFTFKIHAADNLVVTHLSEDNAETILLEGDGDNEYTLDVPEYPGIGEITYPAGGGGTVLPSGERLSLSYYFPLEQGTGLKNQGDYNAGVVETALDYLTGIDAQLEAQVSTSLKAPIYAAPDANFQIPVPVAGAMVAGVWDDDALAIVPGPTVSEIVNAEISAHAAAASAVAAFGFAADAEGFADEAEGTKAEVEDLGDGVSDEIAAFHEDFSVMTMRCDHINDVHGWEENPVVAHPITELAAPYSVNPDTDIGAVLNVTGETAITLPAVATAVPGFYLDVIGADSSVQTVEADGAELIKSIGDTTGVSSIPLRFPGQQCRVRNTGSLWLAEHNMQPLVPSRVVDSTSSLGFVDNGYTIDLRNTKTVTLPLISAVPIGFNVRLRVGDVDNLKTIVPDGADTIEAFGDTGLTAVGMSRIGNYLDFVNMGTRWVAAGDVTVEFRCEPTETQPVLGSVLIDFGTPESDTHNGWSDPDNWYVVPYRGVYTFNLNITVSTTTSRFVQLWVSIDTVGARAASYISRLNGGAQRYSQAVTGDVMLNAGQRIMAYFQIDGITYYLNQPFGDSVADYLQIRRTGN